MTQLNYEEHYGYRRLDNPYHLEENSRRTRYQEGRRHVTITVTRHPTTGFQLRPSLQNQTTENHRGNLITRFVSRFFYCCGSNEER